MGVPVRFAPHRPDPSKAGSRRAFEVEVFVFVLTLPVLAVLEHLGVAPGWVEVPWGLWIVSMAARRGPADPFVLWGRGR